MFFFSDKSKKAASFQPKIRRLCDLTTPNLVTGESGRSANRYNRAIPTLLCPWQDGEPLADGCVFGLTKDIADGGVGLILNKPFVADEAVVGYCSLHDDLCEPWFFLGTVCHRQTLGVGFWTVGIAFTEFANPNYVEELSVLKPFAAKLLECPEMATV